MNKKNLLNSVTAFVFFALASVSLLACGPSGDPELVAKIEKLATEMCNCKDKDCVMKLGGGVLPRKSENLTDEESERYHAAYRKASDCQTKLWQGNKS